MNRRSFLTRVASALAVLGCTGCGQAPATDDPGYRYSIYYTYDARTDLCFASTRPSGDYSTALVPCTDAVRKVAHPSAIP